MAESEQEIQASVRSVLGAAAEQADGAGETGTDDPWKKRAQDAQREMSRAQEAEKAARQQAEALQQAANERLESIERQMQALFQRQEQAAPFSGPAPGTDLWTEVTDEYGNMNPTALAKAIAFDRDRDRQELLTAVQGMLKPVVASMGSNAKDQYLSNVPNGPHKQDFERRLQNQIDIIAAQQGVDPAVVNNPKSIQFLARNIVGKMLEEGKLVFAVSGGANDSPTRSSGPEPDFGPDFGVPSTPGSEEEWETRLDLSNIKEMREYTSLEPALAEHGIKLNDLLKDMARAEKAKKARSK